MAALKTVLAIVLIFVALPVVVLKVIYYIADLKNRRQQKQNSENVPGTPAYRTRLVQPRFAELEEHLQTILPDAFKQLYANHALVQSLDFFLVSKNARQFTDAVNINYFLPADKNALEYLPTKSMERLPFAVDGAGNVYFLALDKENKDGHPVYIHYLDGDDQEKVADSLQELLSWPRLSRKDTVARFKD